MESDGEALLNKPKGPPPYTAFSNRRRQFLLAIVTVAAFLTPVSGNIYLPALPTLAREFKVSDVAINVSVSLFMLVFAIAPLFWGAGADFMGRKPLYTISFLVFIAANIVLAAIPPNYGWLLFFRIVQAIGASSVASLGAGTVADLYEPKIRASAISIFMLGAQLGPVLGPMIGGAIAGAGGSSWRWIFGFLAILGSVIWAWMLFCLPETLRARAGNSAIHADRPWISWPDFSARAPIEPGTIVMKRPSAWNTFKLLRYAPITLVSTNVAILFGSYYCVAITLPTVLEREYHFSATAIGLSYIPSGVAMVTGGLLSGQYANWDRARAAEASEDGKTVIPEQRIKSQLFGVVLFPFAIELYGWFTRYHIHPAAVLIATFFIGFAMSWVVATNTTYLTEVKPGQAATLVAIAGLFRNPAAALASVIIDPIVDGVGMGWTFRGVAFLDLACVIIVIVLIWHGPAWRKSIQAEIEAEKAKDTQPAPAVTKATAAPAPAAASQASLAPSSGLR